MWQSTAGLGTTSGATIIDESGHTCVRRSVEAVGHEFDITPVGVEGNWGVTRHTVFAGASREWAWSRSSRGGCSGIPGTSTIESTSDVHDERHYFAVVPSVVNNTLPSTSRHAVVSLVVEADASRVK